MITALIFLTPAMILSAYASLLLKKGAPNFSVRPKSMLKNNRFLLGVLLYCTSVLFYLKALQHASLSVLYPLSSFVYVLVALLSVRHLGEKMNRRKWIGIIFIIAGSILIV